MAKWFAVYEVATGRLKSVGTTKTDPLAEGDAFKQYPKQPDQGGVIWDETALNFIPKTPDPPTKRDQLKSKDPQTATIKDIFEALQELL